MNFFFPVFMNFYEEIITFPTTESYIRGFPQISFAQNMKLELI